MLTTLLAPHTIHPGVGASAWLPRGRGRHEALRATLTALGEYQARDTAGWTPDVLGGRPDVDRGRGLRHGTPGMLWPAGRPGGAAPRRRGRVLLDPGLDAPTVIDGRQ